MDDSGIVARSPLERLSLARFGRRTHIIEGVISVAITPTRLITNNPNRLHIALINEGNFDIRIANLPSVTVTSGWIIPADGGVIFFDWEDDGEGVGYQLWGIASGGAANLRIREVIAL